MTRLPAPPPRSWWDQLPIVVVNVRPRRRGTQVCRCTVEIPDLAWVVDGCVVRARPSGRAWARLPGHRFTDRRVERRVSDCIVRQLVDGHPELFPPAVLTAFLEDAP